MEKISNISILLTFIGLWISSLLNERFEFFLGLILIFSFGILHGSNDILLINKLSDDKTQRTFLNVLITYLTFVFLIIISFYCFPKVTLVLFILFSAYHFGEQHWEHKNIQNKKKVFFLTYGLFILFLLFTLNKLEVLEIVESMTHFRFGDKWIDYAFIFTTITLISLIIVISRTNKLFKSQLIKEIFFLAIFAIVFKIATLIWAFTIYFIFWHSIPSLFEQITFLYGNFNSKAMLSYTIKALPYWLISIIGINIVFFVFRADDIFDSIFFSFIAAVTFPHSIIINKMFRNKKSVTK